MGAVNGDLSNQFIETLGIQLLSGGADSSFSSLHSLESIIELFLEHYHIGLGGRCTEDALLIHLSPLLGFDWG